VVVWEGGIGLINFRWIVAVGLSFTLFLSGCVSGASTLVSSAGPAEKKVAERAQARWEALLQGEFNSAYGYISPAGRSKLQARDYRIRVSIGHIRRAEVKGASCTSEVCQVRVQLDHQLEGIPLSQEVSETWIFDQGAWWFVYKG
jgi:hypothetical protein